jgi:hypothetical protein
MNEEDKDGKGDPPAEDRTVFMPPSSAGGSAQAEEETVRQPSPKPDSPTAAPTVIASSFQPRTDGQAIQVGDVLNHIFEVKRFIARGGMGEVFEGVNVNSDERVAIKVMLPSLAADPNVIAMFRKEARTLTRLQHEALVDYRVLAQEPQLGVLYIVTEYIDGVNLSDVLGKVKPTPEEIAQLLARLASGLRAAHALGAVHRDMSPDNVLLEGGALSGAKIIDFGIAKDLDPGSKTIIGEGFAGKLSYVAPEQLGDFGREVGPWTDVYSLGLVILAVAQGKNIQMGGSLVDAVDKRRAGPDLAAVPENIRPVLERMLKADPKQRLRSMDEVLAAMGHTARGSTIAPERRGLSKGVLIGGGLAVAAVVAAAIAYFALGSEPVTVKREPAQVAASAINSVLPSVGCTWLEVSQIASRENGVAVAMKGVAGNRQAAQEEIGRALAGAGVQNASLDFAGVAPITQAGCAALDTYRLIRAERGDALTAASPTFERSIQSAGLPYAGQLGAVVELDFKPASDTDFTILGIEPSGIVTQMAADRAALDAIVADQRSLPESQRAIVATPEGYKLRISSDHAGWTGYLVITGRKPFDASLTAPALSARGPDWQNRFAQAAANQDWRAEMEWVNLVDERPD